jgi:hypothetical protein
MTLLDDLRGATEGPQCPLCVLIRDTEDEETREELSAAAAGTMGTRKLAEILRQHHTGIGRRTVIRHRNERHES